ncbi:MAG: hypothetical protein COA79_23095 [Planctomycetota bacterium]|nr:MAG: hypothetical protein COA79_23095 [Planctomycetota bacterium]
MSESSNDNSGIGFIGLLTIVFITLKLCGVIAWSWWWVWSPVWITALVIIFIIGVALMSAGIYSMHKKKRT